MPGQSETVVAPFAVHDLRRFLEGAWSLSRSIEDRIGDQRGRLDGTVVFAPDSADLIYRERGILSLGGYRGRTERVYRFAFSSAARAAVAFHDGRPFHELDLTAGACAVEHRCGADVYLGTFRTTAEDRWQVVWQVSGPRKDHTLTTRYCRTS